MTTQKIRDILNRAREGFALVTFEARCYEPKRQDLDATRKAAKEHGCTPADLTVVKATVIDPNFAAIKSVLSRARNYHYKCTKSWAGRRVGIIRGQDLLDYAMFMNDCRKEYTRLVDRVIEAWPETVAAQADRLNGLFKIEDYPTVSELRRKFLLRYTVNQLPERTDWVLDVPEDVVEELAGSFEDQMQDRIDELKQTVLEETRAVLENTRKVLSKSDPQAIRNALTANCQKQVSWLRSLNIDKDPKVSTIVNEIEGGILKDTADTLRDDEAARGRALTCTVCALNMIGEASN